MDLPRRRGPTPGSRPRLPALSTPRISSLALCFISSWKGAFFSRAAVCDLTVSLTATVENTALSLYFPARRLSPHPRPCAVCIPVFGKGVLLMGGAVGRRFLRLVCWVCTCQVLGPELMLLERLPRLRGRKGLGHASRWRSCDDCRTFSKFLRKKTSRCVWLVAGSGESGLGGRNQQHVALWSPFLPEPG